MFSYVIEVTTLDKLHLKLHLILIFQHFMSFLDSITFAINGTNLVLSFSTYLIVIDMVVNLYEYCTECGINFEQFGMNFVQEFG